MRWSDDDDRQVVGVSDKGERYHVTLCCNYMEPAEALRRIRSLMRGWGTTDFKVLSTNERHWMRADPNVTFRVIRNDWNDFSGYMHACQEIAPRAAASETEAVYLFLNDTLLVRHPARLLMRRLRKAVPTIRNCVVPIIVGRADSYETLLQTSPFVPGLDRYISTFLFATNREGVSLLDQLIGDPETISMIRSAAQLEAGTIPPALYAFLQLHLKTDGSRFSWQGARKGGSVERKAGGVLLEHLISARFYKEGFIFPINYNVTLELLLWAAYRVRRWTE